MRIELSPVSRDEKEILRNLLEKYQYEFSQFEHTDVNTLGLYGYNWLDCYWTEKNRWAFFIRVEEKLAGFVMINDYLEARKDGDFTIAEFFVMHKYRRLGVGKYAAKAVFDRFPGKWELKRHPKNIASVRFWDSIISEYTGGKYELVRSYPEFPYPDGTFGDIFFFET